MKPFIKPNAGPTSQPTRLNVLYVEDEETNWEITERELRPKFLLHWARDDKQACDKVRAFNGFHAILMDIQLKGSRLNGVQLTRLFRGQLPPTETPDYGKGLPILECPIFFVSAYGQSHQMQDLLAAGGDDHVPKPVNFVRLSLLLATAGAKRVAKLLAPARPR